MESETPPRLRCIVIGCRRTAAQSKYPNATEIICAKCARRVKGARRIYRRAQRRYEKFPTQNNLNACERLWSAFKRLATEVALGIR